MDVIRVTAAAIGGYLDRHPARLAMVFVASFGRACCFASGPCRAGRLRLLTHSFPPFGKIPTIKARAPTMLPAVGPARAFGFLRCSSFYPFCNRYAVR